MQMRALEARASRAHVLSATPVFTTVLRAAQTFGHCKKRLLKCQLNALLGSV